MRLKFLAALLALSSIPAGIPAGIPAAAADRSAIVQGAGATVIGFARVRRGAEGTYIELESSNSARSIAGFIAFRNEGTFPGVMALNGKRVQLTGMVAVYGRPMIMINAPEQIQVL
jgi:hypothetical protein